MEQVVNIEQALRLISDLDWVASGATNLLNSVIEILAFLKMTIYANKVGIVGVHT